MIQVITFLGLICASYLFTEGAEPIQDIKKMFGLDAESDYINKYQWFMLKMLNCSLCFSFWLGLFFYCSIPLAALTSVCGELLARTMKKF